MNDRTARFYMTLFLMLTFAVLAALFNGCRYQIMNIDQIRIASDQYCRTGCTVTGTFDSGKVVEVAEQAGKGANVSGIPGM